MKKAGSAIEYTSAPLMELVRDVLPKIKAEAENVRLLTDEADFSMQLGIVDTRLRSLLYQVKSISGDELQRIFDFGDKVAAKSKDPHFRLRLAQQRQEASHLVHPFAADARDAYEEAMRAAAEMCHLSREEQEALGGRIAGNYLLFRRDHEGQLILSSLRVRAPARPGDLLTFSTHRRGKGGTRRTRGFMYFHDPYICALGHTANTKSIRLSLLHPIATLYERDLAGLRLGVNTMDRGVLAHPIYLHRIDDKPFELPKTGKVPDFDATELRKIHSVCPKFDEIVVELDKLLWALPPVKKGAEHRWRFGVALDF